MTQLTEAQERGSQFATRAGASRYARYLSKRCKRGHKAIKAITWRELEECSCWTVVYTGEPV